jgi:hypothetical protein
VEQVTKIDLVITRGPQVKVSPGEFMKYMVLYEGKNSSASLRNLCQHRVSDWLGGERARKRTGSRFWGSGGHRQPALVAIVVAVDILFFRNRFWERLMVNVGIVLVFWAFYLRFLKPP